MCLVARHLLNKTKREKKNCEKCFSNHHYHFVMYRLNILCEKVQGSRHTKSKNGYCLLSFYFFLQKNIYKVYGCFYFTFFSYFQRERESFTLQHVRQQVLFSFFLSIEIICNNVLRVIYFVHGIKNHFEYGFVHIDGISYDSGLL